jgi:hypothetical protein
MQVIPGPSGKSFPDPALKEAFIDPFLRQAVYAGDYFRIRGYQGSP